jgi:cysteinylglycine-S-conjugate dipeptidase
MAMGISRQCVKKWLDRFASAGEEGLELEEAVFRGDAGVPAGVELAGTGSLTSRLWAKPALVVTGIDAPGTAVVPNSFQPVARARVSISIPPGNEPVLALEALERHLLAHAPFGVEVSLHSTSGSRPFAVDMGVPAVRVMRWAMGQAWGTAAVDMGIGGAIPIVAELAGRFPQAQILITRAEDRDTRAHGTDESLDVEDLRRGMLAEALLPAWLNRRAGPH